MADVTINNLTGQAPTNSDVFPFSTTGVTPSTYKASLTQIKASLGLATVATTGSYNDLIDRPNIGFGGLQLFASSGTFTVPTGVTKVKVTCIGGGGGFGGASSAGVSGGRGGGGGAAIKILNVLAGQDISITVGGGGQTGSRPTPCGQYGGTGGTGGTSSFGNMSATGGNGGGGGYNGCGTGLTPQIVGSPGTGGTGLNGDINITGVTGGLPAIRYSEYGTGSQVSGVLGIAGCVIVEW